ncbi:MAG: MFS transporter, partial [Pseudomonadota bacterium]
MRLDLSFPVILIAIAETLVWAALFYTFPILLLRWEGDFGWRREEIALAFTLALAISALASPLAGRLIDRGLSRFMFPAAALFGAVMLAMLSMAETKAAFFASWALIGVATSACLYEPCFAFLTRAKGAGARSAITTVTLVAGFASTLCFPLADWIADGWGWRTAALVFAGMLGAVGARANSA